MSGVSWLLEVLEMFHGCCRGWCEMFQGVVRDVSGGGVIIPHYPHTRRLCSPVTPGFIELAAAIEPTHSSCSTLCKKILYRWKIYTTRHTSQISHSSDGQPVVRPTKFNISDAASNLVTMCYLRIEFYVLTPKFLIMTNWKEIQQAVPSCFQIIQWFPVQPAYCSHFIRHRTF